MPSIRGPLTLILVLTLGLLLLGSGGLLYIVIQAQLLGDFDRVLLAKAKDLMTLTEYDGTRVELDTNDIFMPEFDAADQLAYFALWLASGQLIQKSPSLGEHDLLPRTTLTNAPVFRNVVLPHGHAGRLVEMAFVPRLDPDTYKNQSSGTGESVSTNWAALDPTRFPERAVVLLVARNRAALDTFLRTLPFVLAMVIIGLLAIMVGLVRIALRLGLRPLDDVRRQVEHLDAHSLQTGLQVNTQTHELIPVVAQLNALLRRLDASFARERQFSNDVAHELRTPLAELRTLTEEGLRWPDDVDVIKQYFADVQAIGQQIERIVVSLLTLARCANGVQQVSLHAINLRELVEASWAPMARLAQEKALQFHCTLPSRCDVISDQDMLLTVLSNILSNAVVYSSPQSAIHCLTTMHGSTMRLTCNNPTQDLTPADVPHIFERFWRKDHARSPGEHTGLGLAIVKALSKRLDLEVHATLDPEDNFAISISLPCASDG